MKKTFRNTVRLALALMLVVSALGAAGTRYAAAQEKGDDNAARRAPVAGQTIDGAPLDVTIYDDLSAAVNYDGRQQFYSGRASGTFVVVGGTVYGPNVPAGNSVVPYTPVSNVLVNASTIETVANIGLTGLQIKQVTTYNTGNVLYNTDITIINTTGIAQDVRIFHGADLYLNFPGNTPDLGNGFYDATRGAVGAISRDGQYVQVFLSVGGTPPDAYQEARYFAFWDLIGTGAAPGPGFNNSIDPSYHDVAAGFQWNRTVAANSSVTVSDQAGFGTAEQLGVKKRVFPADISVVQRPSPNTSVEKGGIVSYVVEAKNWGKGQSKQTYIYLPFDPAAVKVLDVTFINKNGWVSKLDETNGMMELQTGSLGANGGVITATVRLQTLANVPTDTNLGKRLTYDWLDEADGGKGQSNKTMVMVGATTVNKPLYTMSNSLPSGLAGSKHVFTSPIFAPNEPVDLWYNKPDGSVVSIGRARADNDGLLTEPLTTVGFKAGRYSIVGYGVWTKFTAVSDFEVTTTSTSKAKPKAAPKPNTVRKIR